MGKGLRRGDFNFCEAVFFHCKKINYSSGESYEVTYEILEGWKKRICIWCSFILRRLVIGCLEKCVGIVKEELFTFLLYLLEICMSERRLRIRMLERAKGLLC